MRVLLLAVALGSGVAEEPIVFEPTGEIIVAAGDKGGKAAISKLRKVVKDETERVAAEITEREKAEADATVQKIGELEIAADEALTVEREVFARAVDRVSTISSERGRAVKLALTEGKLVLSVTNPDQGSAVEEIEADYDGAPLDVGFNARYLLDITQQLDSDTALFKLADPGSPTLIQDRDGANALYVLMPMRV